MQHAIFSVAAKFIGMFVAFLALAQIATAPVFFPSTTAAGIGILMSAVFLAAALLLIFRTEQAARALRIGPPSDAPLETRAAHRTGTILIGLYVFFTHGLVATVMIASGVDQSSVRELEIAAAGALGFVQDLHIDAPGLPWSMVMARLVPVALALVFIARPDWVISLAMRTEGRTG